MKSSIVSAVLAALFLNLNPTLGATTNLYSAQFESSEGYNTNLDLVGQAGWVSAGSGGNGVLTRGITGQGRSAYIGFAPPNPVDDSLVVWQPINFDPNTAGSPVVKFSVVMSIIDSVGTANRDIFRWSVYNRQGSRLFSIGFDNLYLDVGYQLDGTNKLTLPPSLFFTNDTIYTLSVTMNFAANRWSATYNNTLIATNQLITTVNALLDFGDADAVWLVNQGSYTNGLGQVISTNAPGNNYMLFDNYRLTAETLPVTPARVQFLGRTTEGWGLLRVFGDNGSRWALEATTNLVNWTTVKTNLVSGGSYDQVDTTAAGIGRRFYRARFVP